MADKIPFPVDKRAWHPSLIPGPLALVATVDSAGTPNVARKSWILPPVPHRNERRLDGAARRRTYSLPLVDAGKRLRRG